MLSSVILFLQLARYVFDPHLGTLICPIKKATDFTPMVSVHHEF